MARIFGKKYSDHALGILGERLEANPSNQRLIEPQPGKMVRAIDRFKRIRGTEG